MFFTIFRNGRCAFADQMGAAVARNMLANIEEIERYTRQHAELMQAHHWLYDSVYSDGRKPEFVAMGINPGETANDWRIAPGPTEESSRHDFHPKGKGVGVSTGPWMSAARRLLRDAPYVLAEAFFWSSRNQTQFRERYGRLEQSPHLPFCTEMNRRLIEHYDPKAVIVSGISLVPLVAEQYGLAYVTSVPARKGRLLEHYSDGCRPWIITKHWSASFGFSNDERDQIAEYIASACARRSAAEWISSGRPT